MGTTFESISLKNMEGDMCVVIYNHSIESYVPGIQKTGSYCYYL